MNESPDALPWSPAAERNAGPILTVLRLLLRPGQRVLEIGSGTGQHAVQFGRALPGVYWQPSELDGPVFAGLQARLEASAPDNVAQAIVVDVDAGLPAGPWDWIFTANTLHIMAWESVCRLYAAVPGVLTGAGGLIVYGPFRRGGAHTAPSNAAFDMHLRQRDPRSGLRDLEALDALAAASGLTRSGDRTMPANNALLVWSRERRQGSSAAGR